MGADPAIAPPRRSRRSRRRRPRARWPARVVRGRRSRAAGDRGASGRIGWGSFPMAPFAGRVRDGRFTFRGGAYQLADRDAAARHPRHGARPAWHRLDDQTIVTELGPDWPFAGRAIQRFELRRGTLRLPARDPGRRADAGVDRLAPVVPSPAGATVADGAARCRRRRRSNSSSTRARCTGRDADGITTAERVVPGPGSLGRLLHRPAAPARPALARLPRADDRLRLPRLGGLHGPEPRRSASSRRRPRPTPSTSDPAIVEPGRPLIAAMTWTWRSLAG